MGQLAVRSALLLGAERVIAIDHVAERLAMVKRHSDGRSEVLDRGAVDVVEALREMTGGRGPDACIDAVGLEAHGTGLAAWYDTAKQGMMLETDRPTALREAIRACGKGGNVSIPGVYSGLVDKFPLGAAFNKALTLKMGQTHVPRYMAMLLGRIERGEIDPSFIITHRVRLDQVPDAYRTFRDKEEGCVKVVIQP